MCERVGAAASAAAAAAVGDGGGGGGGGEFVYSAHEEALPRMDFVSFIDKQVGEFHLQHDSSYSTQQRCTTPSRCKQRNKRHDHHDGQPHCHALVHSKDIRAVNKGTQRRRKQHACGGVHDVWR
jgi:hypothetical protein